MTRKLPPRSAYPGGPDGDEQRWADYKRLTESSQPRTPITESGDGNAAPTVPEVTPADLARMSVEDPASYRELEVAFAEAVFAHHDARRGGPAGAP